MRTKRHTKQMHKPTAKRTHEHAREQTDDRANPAPQTDTHRRPAPDATALRVRFFARPPVRSSVRAARSRRYRCRSCGLGAALADRRLGAANRRAIRSTAALSLVHSLRGVGDADQDGRGLMEALQPTPLWQGHLRASSLSRVLATPAASCASKLPQVAIRASAQMCARDVCKGHSQPRLKM